MLTPSLGSLTQIEGWDQLLRQINWATVTGYVRNAIFSLSLLYAIHWSVLLIWQFILPNNTLQLLALTPQVHQQNTNLNKSNININESKINIKQILDWHLFGAPIVNPIDAKTLQAAERIKATLVGVMYSSNEKVARAIIKMDKVAEQKHYQIGDILKDTSAILSKIEIDHVILSLGEKIQILPLFAKDDEDKDDDLGKPDQLVDKRNDAKAKRATKKFRALLSKDITQINKFLRFFAVKKEGKIIGYNVAAKRDHGDFAAMGFRNGDVITTVDGIPLVSLYNMQKIIRSISNGGEFSFYVLRNNSYLELLVNSE